ncbi:MAG TPA: hypothetical protein VJ832_20775, partial [Variovorax sp.]|nr:hypothetical protein [Variovorax sp.]
MTAKTRHEVAAIDPDDIGHNNSSNPSFNDLIASRLSRRHLFGLGVGTAGTALLQACGGGGSGGFPVLPAAPALAPLVRAWPWLRRTLMRLVRRETAKWTAPLADLRARHGLPPGANPLIEGQYSPHLNLALFSRVMADPQADWPPRTRVTGFVFYNGPAALPPSLEAFLGAGPPPV